MRLKKGKKERSHLMRIRTLSEEFKREAVEFRKDVPA